VSVDTQLHALMANATLALARLDAEALDEMSVRALALKRAGAALIPIDRVPELTARLRVFAAAMEATRANLEFRTAISAPELGGVRALRRMPWER